MKITVIGMGYVGLVTACCLAEQGHQVFGIDTDREKINQLLQGQPPIHEPDLLPLLQTNLHEQRLHFSIDPQEFYTTSDVAIIAVGTPAKKSGESDLSQLDSVIQSLQDSLRIPPYLVIKSTVPPQTTDQIYNALKHKLQDVICNPEFLRQGQAVQDFIQPDRIVAGVHKEKNQSIIKQLYHFVDSSIIQFSEPINCELIKYASNAFLATKISFINQFAEFAEQHGADINAIAQGIGADPRIGPDFLQAGIGYGGSCLPKDITSMLQLDSFPLLQAAREINQDQPQRILQRIREELGTIQGKKVALWGLTFKPGTDDLRESPSLTIAQLLLSQGAKVTAHDPMVHETPIPEMKVTASPLQATEQADTLIIATGWEAYQTVSWREVVQSMKQPVVFDGRNLFSLEEMHHVTKQYGLKYHSIGRKSIR